MKAFRYYFLLLLAGLGMTACTKNFDKMVADPEAVQAAPAGSFLNNVLFNGANIGMYEALNVSNELIQTTVYTAETIELQRYIIKSNVSDYAWSNYYQNLTDVRDMRAAAIRDKQPNCQGISLVLWAWLFENLTDIYSDIPYTQALNGYPNYVLQPTFDRQEFIYQDLINKLDTANSLITVNTVLESGSDLLYHTDSLAANMIYWKELANSLRLRLLMRVAQKSPDAQAQINMIFNNPTQYPVMTSNTATASVRYGATAPFINPYATSRTADWNGDRRMSEFFIDTLKAWNDPRMALWATSVTGIGYVGLPSGFPRTEQSIATQPASSLLATLQSSSLTGQIMEYAEVQFIEAEAILRGYMTGSALTAYQNAVTANIQYWGATVPSDYFTRPGVAYEGTIQQVLTQKYFALFFNDMQQWFEINRTGYPILPKGDATIGRQLPCRLAYPLTIQSTNPTNYKAAVADMGGDSDTTHLWWMQ